MHKPAVALAALALLFGCRGSYGDEAPLEDVPFAGPGWQDGALVDPQPTYWAAITVLLVSDDPAAIPTRDHWVRHILSGIDEIPGHVGHRVEVHDDNGVPFDDPGWGRTYTVWRSEEALDEFVRSDLHLSGLPELQPFIETFESGRWQVAASDIPEDWDADRLWERHRAPDESE